jgi:hypothetical protein
MRVHATSLLLRWWLLAVDSIYLYHRYHTLVVVVGQCMAMVLAERTTVHTLLVERSRSTCTAHPS